MNVGKLYKSLKSVSSIYDAFEAPLFRQACLQHVSEAQYTSEAMFFFARLEVGKLLECKPIDLCLTFLEVISNELSFSPASNLVYLFAQSVYKDKVLVGYKPDLRYSPLGKMMLKPNVSHEQPVVVFDCDKYTIKNTSQGVQMEHKPANPRPEGAKVVGGFIRLFRNGIPTIFTYTASDFENWRKKSNSPNSPAWGGEQGVFKGFENAVPMLKSKIVSHAYNSMPNTNAPVAEIVPKQDDVNALLAPLREQYEKLLSVTDRSMYLSFEDLRNKKDIDLYEYVENVKENVAKHYEWLCAKISKHEPTIKMPNFNSLLDGDQFVSFVQKAQGKVSQYPKDNANE